MKRPLRVILSLLCVLLTIGMLFILPSPIIVDEAWDAADALDSGAAWLFPGACAEEYPEYALPIDLSAGYEPDPELFTPQGYEDDSIRVQMETREENGVVWRIAWVEVASATQLRTAVVGTPNASRGVNTVLEQAKTAHAVVALNGDYYRDNPDTTTFEYRMGIDIREKGRKASKPNWMRDTLIIDENGDFHTFVHLSKKPKDENWGPRIFEETTGHRIINAFTFGPALVHEGELLTMDKNYKYNPGNREPRSAIGQNGPLSYVMVVAEGRSDKTESLGVTHQELADFMYGLGCTEAYNLDGGGTASMVYDGKYFNILGGSERSISDIIYFATAVEPEGK